jgi:hypothetical protein
MPKLHLPDGSSVEIRREDLSRVAEQLQTAFESKKGAVIQAYRTPDQPESAVTVFVNGRALPYAILDPEGETAGFHSGLTPPPPPPP